jgi:hypothetical protein
VRQGPDDEVDPKVSMKAFAKYVVELEPFR